MDSEVESAYEVRVSWDGVAGNDGCADTGQELIAGDNLLAHEMAAALRLHLILDVARRETDARVLRDCAGDVGGSTKPANEVSNVKEKQEQGPRTRCQHRR